MLSATPRVDRSRQPIWRRTAAIGAGAAIALSALTGCASGKADVVLVPQDAATITQALEKVNEGGLVLIDTGTYAETVLVDVPGVTVRGTDRNSVVIDGEGIRPEGIVVIADGVRVENLTVHSNTFNGVLVTGMHDGTTAAAHGLDGYSTLDPEKFPPIQTFSIDHVTAYNNGLYGIYAFDSQHGSITNSYASGSADSGFYVGQCQECDILVQGNTAENNAVGFENANASDSVYILGNDWSGNRVGMTLSSNYQEAFVPQRANVVIGNRVSDNQSPQSPAQADGGFGIGIGILGGQDNRIERNSIEGNLNIGVLIQGAEDIPARGNSMVDNVFSGNTVDIANLSQTRTPASNNCVTGVVITAPEDLFAQCAGEQPSSTDSSTATIAAPPGVSFLKLAAPPAQPSRVGNVTTIPPALPRAVTVPDLTGFTAPPSGWVAGE